MLLDAILSPEFIGSVVVAVALAVAMCFVAAHYNKEPRVLYGGSFRPLLATATTLTGILLTLSTGALVYVVQKGRLADAGFLLAAVALQPVILIMAVWVLAGTIRYYQPDADKLTFPAKRGWPYFGALGAIYILLILTIVLTLGFFVLRASLFLPPVPQKVVAEEARVEISRQPIRVGDSRSLVLALWGRPDSTHIHPRALFYSNGATVITVSLDSLKTSVVRVTLERTR